MRTKSFFMALLSFASLTASAQQSETQTADSLVKAAYFVDGKYYSKELPTDEADAQSMGFVTLSKDYMIVNITLRKGATVPQSWAKYEIPRNRVKGIAEIDEEIKNRELMNKRMFPEGGYKYLELEVGKPLPSMTSMAIHGPTNSSRAERWLSMPGSRAADPVCARCRFSLNGRSSCPTCCFSRSTSRRPTRCVASPSSVGSTGTTSTTTSISCALWAQVAFHSSSCSTRKALYAM